jgi:abortive infection bacteriophage resistance protein
MQGFLFEGGTMAFDKPNLSYEDQLALFESRGMAVNNRERALERLRHISYYKIKEFSMFFMTGNRYNPGTSFEAVIQNFYFDKTLRFELLSMSEKIELSIKNKFSYLMGGKYGPFGYLKFHNWIDRKIPLNQIKYEEQNFAKKIKEKETEFAGFFLLEDYYANFPEEKRIPVWVMTELLTFGEIIHLLKLMSHNNKLAVAKKYGLLADEFGSFIENIRLIRNLCAHNHPVINLTIKSVPVIPESFRPYLCETNKIATSVLIFVWFVKTIRPEYDFGSLKKILFKLIKREKVARMYGFASVKAIKEFIALKT